MANTTELHQKVRQTCFFTKINICKYTEKYLDHHTRLSAGVEHLLARVAGVRGPGEEHPQVAAAPVPLVQPVQDEAGGARLNLDIIIITSLL